MSQIDEVYFAVSMHVDGDDVIKSAITNISVTASSFRLRSGKLINIDGEANQFNYQRYLKPHSETVLPEFMKTSEWVRDDLLQYGENPKVVAKELKKFVKSILTSMSSSLETHPKAVFMGYDIANEATFLANLFAKNNVKNPFTRVLDLRTVYAVKLNSTLQQSEYDQLPAEVRNTRFAEGYHSTLLMDQSRDLAIIGHNLLRWSPDPF